MKALILILKHIEHTNTIIHQLAEAGVRGGTILDGTGMADALLDMEDLPIFGMLRHLLENEDKEKVHVMMFVLEDQETIKVRKIIKGIIGDFNKPNTGIMFSIPIEDVEGFGE